MNFGRQNSNYQVLDDIPSNDITCSLTVTFLDRDSMTELYRTNDFLQEFHSDYTFNLVLFIFSQCVI